MFRYCHHVVLGGRLKEKEEVSPGYNFRFADGDILILHSPEYHPLSGQMIPCFGSLDGAPLLGPSPTDSNHLKNKISTQEEALCFETLDA